MEEKIAETVESLINKANELYNLANDEGSSPLSSGRYLWERKGIIFAIKEICEHTQLFEFDSLFRENSIEE
jgi:hypothetical protein